MWLLSTGIHSLHVQTLFPRQGLKIVPLPRNVEGAGPQGLTRWFW